MIGSWAIAPVYDPPRDLRNRHRHQTAPHLPGWAQVKEVQIANDYEQLFQGTPTYSSHGGNKALEAKIAQAVTVVVRRSGSRRGRRSSRW